MAKRIPWDESEALLLFDAFDLIQKYPQNRKQIINALSINLRRRAEDHGVSIDSVFRNVAGINMRLSEVERILDPTSSGLSNTSILFRKVAKMYISHRRTFLKKLKEEEEYQIVIQPDLVSFDQLETVVLLDGYLKLSAPGETKAHMARLISARLRSLAVNRGYIINDAFRTEGGITGRLNRMDQAFTGSAVDMESVPQVFKDTVSLYRTNREGYKKLLRKAEKLIGSISLPEDEEKARREKQKLHDAKPVVKTKYIKTKKDRKLKETYPKAFITVYNALYKRFYTDPKGVTATDIFGDLQKIYPRKIIMEILDGASWAKECADGKYVHELGDEIMATQESVEKKFFRWLRTQLSEKQVANIERNTNMISMMLLKQRVFKKPLFMIADKSELISKKDKVPGCFAKVTVRSDAIQLINYYITYLEKTTTAENTKNPGADDNKTKEEAVVIKTCDASQTGYYNWLSQHELLSGPSCRSYVSSIRSCENYAKDHGYPDHALFTEDLTAATKTIITLLNDNNFLAEHGSYRAHLKRYMQYLGIDISNVLTKSITPNPIKQPNPIVDPKLIRAVEDTVKGCTDGITATELEDRFSQYTDSDRRSAYQAASIIPIMDKYYHKDNIEDFGFMVDTLYDTLCHQFANDGGYTSAHALYKEVAPKLDDFFFYNGAFDSRTEIYDLAAYLFGSAGYKNANFIFYGKQHIWKEEPDYSKNYGGLMIKYAREHGNVISRDEAMDYVTVHGSGTPAQTVSLILNKSGWKNFLQYAENQFVIAEALNVDDSFINLLCHQIETLLEGEDYVALGDVSDYFYSTLPELPFGVTWGPLLLESILERYETGFITIDAGSGNDLKTIDAALLRKNSAFKTFADIVWNELKHDYTLPHTFASEEFRLYLLGKGFLHGQEKINTVHKTVANDLRFYWTDGYSKVTVSNS